MLKFTQEIQKSVNNELLLNLMSFKLNSQCFVGEPQAEATSFLASKTSG